MLALITLGIVMSCLGLIYTDNYVEELYGHCVLGA